MAKKRRKPQNRSRNRPSSAATRTAERPGSPTAEPDRTQDVVEDGATPQPKTAPRKSPPSTRPSAGSQRTRAEKKELAREQRERVRKQIARQQRRRQMVWLAGLTVVVAVGVYFLTNRNDTTTSANELPGVLKTDAPWDANAAQSAARATALGLPAEGTTMHEHANVQIFIHGTQQPVPTDIGIDASAGTIQSIHTHDTTGTVHLESSVSREFTLADFFGVWGVRFTPSCLGSYCNDGSNHLQVFVNGEEVTGSLQDVQLDDQSVVVVTYGTANELPDPIPSTFDFASVAP